MVARELEAGRVCVYVQGQGLLESGVRDGCMVIMVISIPPFCFRYRENSYAAKCNLSEWICVYISARDGWCR